jgi:hypothetical protein
MENLKVISFEEIVIGSFTFIIFSTFRGSWSLGLGYSPLEGRDERVLLDQIARKRPPADHPR